MSLGKQVLNRDCLCIVYFAHIHSHLNYGLLVWGSMISCTQLKELSKLQLQCVELIKKTWLSNQPNLMRSLNILPLRHMIQFSLCKMGHKMTHKLLPLPLQNILNANGGKKPHRYPTRNKHTPNIQKHRSVMFNRSFLCQITNEFVKLSDTLKQEKIQSDLQDCLKKNYTVVDCLLA